MADTDLRTAAERAEQVLHAVASHLHARWPVMAEMESLCLDAARALRVALATPGAAPTESEKIDTAS